VGFGRGTSLWFSPTGYNYIPWSARSSLYSPTTTVVVPQEYVVPRVIESSTTTGPTSNEWALKITKVMDGPAKKADLREGDVIMGVGQTRTQTLSELQQALASARGQVDIVFLNKESQKIEKVQVTPDNGKLGIEVFPAVLPGRAND
jgi:C-terminal processing protease CtpA/Prc